MAANVKLQQPLFQTGHAHTLSLREPTSEERGLIQAQPSFRERAKLAARKLGQWTASPGGVMGSVGMEVDRLTDRDCRAINQAVATLDTWGEATATKLGAPRRTLQPQGTAVPVTFGGLAEADRRRARADDSDDDDTAQAPTIPCDMCEGSGSYGRDDCPACDGEGALTPSQADDRAKNFVDQFKDVQGQVQGRKPVGADPAPKPGSMAAKVLQAGREANHSDRTGKPKPGSFAAQVIAAGKQARGER